MPSGPTSFRSILHRRAVILRLFALTTRATNTYPSWSLFGFSRCLSSGFVLPATFRYMALLISLQLRNFLTFGAIVFDLFYLWLPLSFGGREFVLERTVNNCLHDVPIRIHWRQRVLRAIGAAAALAMSARRLGLARRLLWP